MNRSRFAALGCILLHSERAWNECVFPPLPMQSFDNENLDAIDAAMASFPQYGTGELAGIDVSPIRSSTRERMKRTHAKKHTETAIIEPLERRDMPSGSTLDTVPAIDAIHDATMLLRKEAMLSATNGEGALILNGNGYGELAQQEIIDVGTGNFTIDTSVKFERSGQIEMIVTNMIGGSLQQGYMLRRHGDGTIEFGLGQNFSGNQMHCIKTTENFNDLSRTYRITATRQDSALRIFVDGKEQSTKLWEGTPGSYDVTNGAPVIIGAITWADVYQLKGRIDDLDIYASSLTPDDIASMARNEAITTASQETTKPTLFRPLSDSSFGITLNNGATRSEGIVDTNGGTAKIENSEALNVGTDDFTISASVQFQRNNEIEMILFKFVREPQTKGYGLRKMNNNTIQGLMNDGNGNMLALNSVGKITDTTQFHDISMVRKNGILGLWIDGVEQQTTVIEGAQNKGDLSNPAPLIIGATDGGDYHLNAQIKDLMMTKGAYTPAEIVELKKAQNSPTVSQETVEAISETLATQQDATPTIETYTEPEFVSFANVPNGLYAPGQFHTVNLTPEIKIRLYSDNMFEVDNGTIVPTGSGNDWIHVSLAEGQSAIPVSSVRVRYNPYGGGAAGTLNVLSEDDQNRVTKLSQEGDIPVVGPVKRVLMTLEGHRGALLGMTMNVTKTREILVPLTKEPAETIEGLSEETLTTIAEVVASQETESVTEPAAPEIVDEHAPLLRVVSVQGSNITLAVSSPMAGGNSVRFLNLQDDGLFTNSVIQGTTDGSVTPVSLGMNAANGTGNYRIALVGGPNASTLASVEVHWDRDSKKLSLAGNEKLWECSEALGKAMNTQTQEVLALAKNPMVGSGVLQAMQQESLIDGIRALPSSGLTIPEFESSFWNAHPEWKDDAIHETAIRESQTSRYTATQIFNRIVTQRNDTLSILRDAYSRYFSQLGELLQEGVRVLSAVRNGGNEPDIRRNFAILVDQISTNLNMYKLSGIGIRIPDAGTLLEAVKSVWTVKCEELIRINAETARLQSAELYQAKLIAKGFIELPDGQKVAADDPRASTKLVFFLDEMNRPTLRPQGEVAEQRGITYGLDSVTGTNLVASTNNEIISSIYESHGLKLTNGEFDGTQDLRIYPTKFGDITFTITQDSMVNLWTGGNALKNLSLTLKGGSLPEDGYNTFTKTGISGDSISLRLTPGNYTVRIQDQTRYDNTNFPVTYSGNSAFVASAGVEIKKYNSAAIHGKMTIEGNPDVMPVSMSVAEFDPNTGRRLENPNHGLDPSKPVWVVIHGREDRDDSGKMLELEKALTDSGYQVVTIDWREAAGSNIPESAGMQSEAWIQAVGDWCFRALKAMGIEGSNTRIGGHSFGSFVGFEIAEHFKEENGFGVDTFIALDSAKDATLSARYDASQVNIASVSKTSTAFHSSFWGSEGRSNTAEHTVELRSPRAALYPLENQTRKHGLAVTAFANLVRLKKIDPTNEIAAQFAFKSSESSTLPTREGTDGWLFVESTLKNGTDSSDQYIDAMPKEMTYTNPDDNLVDSYRFNSLLNLEHSISQP